MLRPLGTHIADEVLSELASAVRKFKRFNSAHEGFAVLHEEVDELWDEVKSRSSDPVRMREEAIQVAAMAIRFVLDCCDRAPQGDTGKDDEP